MTHFYTQTKNGIETRHTVPMVKDPSRTRSSSTTDARKARKNKGEIWYPSVTTVMDVLAKHALIDWKINQHLETAYATPIAERDYAYWMKRVRAETANKMDAAPLAGTNIHNILEKFMRGEEVEDIDNNLLICKNVKNLLLDHCGEQEWEVEKHFVSSTRGYAGCADLKSEHWTIDYKSKRFARQWKPNRMVYKEHHMQLAAYECALNEDVDVYESGSAANIFICLETGEVDFAAHTDKEMDKGWSNFTDCLTLYHRNHYDPFEVVE